MAFKNEVMYSEGRAKLLGHCPRQYWYSVYRMWGGWWYKGRAPPKPAEEAYVAKFAETIPTWIGKIVHERAAFMLQSTRWTSKLSDDQVRDRMLRDAMDAVDIGLRQARTQHGGNPKRRLQLVEVHMGDKVDDDAIRTKVSDLIRSLTAPEWDLRGRDSNANLFLRALRRPERIVSVEDMMSFEVDGIRVNFAIDLMVRAAERGDLDSVIVDWKTGRRRQTDSAQVMTYGAYAASVGWRQVTLMVAYIGRKKVTVHEQMPDLAEADTYIRDRVAVFLEDLRLRLVDGDTIRNEPIESKFESTSDPHLCEYCPFQKICARDGTKP